MSMLENAMRKIAAAEDEKNKNKFANLTPGQRNFARNRERDRFDAAEAERTALAMNGALAGGGIGAVGGTTLGALMKAKDRRERMRNILVGFLAGSATGVGAGTVYDHLA